MSLLSHRFGVRLLAHATRLAVGRTSARFALQLRRRLTSIDEERMPAWRLRDLGFRDGRDTAGRPPAAGVAARGFPPADAGDRFR